MKNFRLLIAYDGTKYLGWQHTQEGPSIEAELQSTLQKILQHPINLQASSRTDAGVHATSQVVNFLSTKESIDTDKLVLSLNALLPKDIVALEAKEMPPRFHPTLDCKGKEYCYYICYGKTQLPYYRLYSWHVHASLNIEKMIQASQYLMGEKDFSSFCNFRKQLHYDHHIRRIDNIVIERIESERLCIRITGNHFLYKMVRNMVGTLVYVGIGKIGIDEIPAILDSHDRTRAGVTAPAHGLFLNRIFY